MEIHRRASPPLPLLLFSFFFFFSLLLLTPALAVKKVYIVYLGAHSHGSPEATLLAQESVEKSHRELLAPILKSKEKAKDAIIYSYTKHINGFAATLEEDEAKEIAKRPGVVSVFPDKARKLHTTRSWHFMHLERNGRIPASSMWTKARFGEDTIIANIDTGVWPESESFSDEGYSPVPSRWRGACVDHSGTNKLKFSCNRKLLGGRYFNEGYKHYGGVLDSSYDSPRDYDGHGSHTLSTAAGNFVPNANYYGLGNGTIKGGSPRARIATYKACWPQTTIDGGCYDSDILAAFDHAIHDGVDVLSVSLGGEAIDYLEDSLAIGSFHAVANGVPVISSAGNDGPKPETVTNVAPWMLTVAASEIDRQFVSNVFVDDLVLQGVGVSNTPLPCKDFYPVIRGEDASTDLAPPIFARNCYPNSLDPEKIKGKIVVCRDDDGETSAIAKGDLVFESGAVGVVLVSPVSTKPFAYTYYFPATQLTYPDGQKLLDYLNTTKSAMGYIAPSKTVNDVHPAPVMAFFSSLGPNQVTPEILKPDITAPGVNILAAFRSSDADPSSPSFYMLSGTSMSCPHATGVAGLLRTLNPDWSPAMIKSAIMTTAMIRDNDGDAMTDSVYQESNAFDYGSGHMKPNRAMDPGLVYDLTIRDYLNFLCGVGYNSTSLAPFGTFTCPSNPPKATDLNYPSITVPNINGTTTVTRRVKNVGLPGTYRARVHAPEGVSVTVNPNVLVFEEFGEEKQFEVTFKWENDGLDYVFGSLIWSDGKHYVRSPLVMKPHPSDQ